ncbi:HDOD domain-containing protein [Aquitalea sp. S1-19]|nr:HDOD domain-containing protein [Aquitalea sp. S1-19]
MNDKILLDRGNTESLLKNLVIPPRPVLLEQLETLRQAGNINPDSLAQLIGQDLALSAAVLKAANSPLLGAQRAITSVVQAISLLGTQSVMHLVNAMVLRSQFSQPSSPALEAYWDESGTSALLVNQLARLVQACPQDSQSFALFRGCGIPLMLLHFPKYSQTLAMTARTRDNQICAIEQALHNTHHAVLGYLLARAWHMPKNFCRAILEQYEADAFERASSRLGDEALRMIALARSARHVWRTQTDLEADPGWNDVGPAMLAYLQLGEIEFQDWRSTMHDTLLA